MRRMGDVRERTLVPRQSMSLPHATRPKEGASPRSTRQLLDELDALMNQMLALPVEDEPAKDPPAPALAATLTIIDPDDDLKIAPPATAPDLGTEIPIYRFGQSARPARNDVFEVRAEQILPESESALP